MFPLAVRRRENRPWRGPAGIAATAALTIAVLPAANGPAAAPTEPTASADAGRVVVLPVSNRSGRSVPSRELRLALERGLADRGFDTLERGELEGFLRRHRMRYTGGLNAEMAQRFRDETGAWAVLIASVDRYDDSGFPEFALTARLISTGDEPRILWMGSEAEAGDGHPGFLDQGLITDMGTVRRIVTGRIVEAVPSRDVAARDGARARKAKGPRRFRPEVHYGRAAPAIVSREAGRIAVLPFSNESTTRHAGQIVSDQLIAHLVRAGSEVIEPGVVRQVLLEARQIYYEGPSVPETDILRVELEADVVIFGEVHAYQESLGAARPPVIGFSMRAIDTARGQVIWSSISHNRGSDGVWFFDVGRVATAHRLASEMTRALVATVRRTESADPARQR